MVSLLPATLLVVALSTLATSQPFTQAEASKHSDFKWNSRKIGNKRVATLRIRKDEERDRRSIPLAEADDDILDTGRRRHHHRHHHGEEARSSVWQADGRGVERARGEEGPIRPGRGLAPLHIAESNLEDRSLRRSRLNDVRPGASEGEVNLANIREALDAAGYHISPSLFKNITSKATATRRRQRADNRVKRTKKTSKEKKNKKAKRRRRKSSKNCRRLKGKRKRRCRQALRRCRRQKGRERKRCRATVFESFPQDDIFSFIEGKTDMSGEEACQYHYLKKCCEEVGMLDEPTRSTATLIKCRFREEFLKCMEEKRQNTCESTFSTRGNMKALRNKIREVVWTPNSCLVSEVIEG